MRIRHLASGKYLAVDTSQGPLEEIGGGAEAWFGCCLVDDSAPPDSQLLDGSGAAVAAAGSLDYLDGDGGSFFEDEGLSVALPASSLLFHVTSTDVSYDEQTEKKIKNRFYQSKKMSKLSVYPSLSLLPLFFLFLLLLLLPLLNWRCFPPDGQGWLLADDGHFGPHRASLRRRSGGDQGSPLPAQQRKTQGTHVDLISWY